LKFKKGEEEMKTMKFFIATIIASLFIVMPVVNAGHPADFSGGFKYSEKLPKSAVEVDLTKKVSRNLFGIESGGVLKIDSFCHRNFNFGDTNDQMVEALKNLGLSGKMPMIILQTKIYNSKKELCGYKIEALSHTVLVNVEKDFDFSTIIKEHKLEVGKSSNGMELSLTTESDLNVLDLSTLLSGEKKVISCKPKILFITEEVLDICSD
jgi:hypothetical protein